MRKIAILGSTGSIGVQALEVIGSLEGMEVAALTAGENADLLYRQIKRFRPKAAAMADSAKALELTSRLKAEGLDTNVFPDIADVFSVGFDFTLNAIVGFAGIIPSFAALEKGDLALANKETVVSCGEALMERASALGRNILPVDSEHSAIFQCLQGNRAEDVERLIITASGGPFRGYDKQRLERVTARDALRHPNWSMGRKITVDSATLMNKGLEMIEAKWLFGMPPERLEAVIHPQSVIHSMIMFRDGAVMAQLGQPDMRVPIQYALTWPGRAANSLPRLDIIGQALSFEAIDTETFPCFGLAMAAMKAGGLVPAVMSAANEAAVSRFLNNEICFNDIPRIIELAMSHAPAGPALPPEALAAAREAFGFANRIREW